MACVIDNTFLTAYDDDYALSAATYCCPEVRRGKDSSEPCAPSTSSWEVATCSSACGARPSMGMTDPGPAVSKITWADFEDDRTTEASSPRSTQSLCDEEEDAFENETLKDDIFEDENSAEELLESEKQVQAPENETLIRPKKIDWAELMDSESEKEELQKLEEKRELWADMQDSGDEEGKANEAIVTVEVQEHEGQEIEVLGEPRQSRPSRASRRARRAAARQVAASDERIETTTGCGIAVPQTAATEEATERSQEHSGKRAPIAAKGAGKGAAKGSKGAAKGAVKGKGADTSKGAGKGKRGGETASKGVGKGSGSEKYQCQIIVGIEEDPKFRVVRRMIGCGGENMKQIAQCSGAKLRLRGRGSKFLEGPEQKESEDDLMLCISAQDRDGYEAAKRAGAELIEGIHHSYRAFCRKAGHACPDLRLHVHEGYRPGSR